MDVVVAFCMLLSTCLLICTTRFSICLFVILCCSGESWREQNKVHKYRIRLKCEGMSDIVFRLQNDNETKKWYEDLDDSLRKKSLIARGGLAPKKPAFLRRLASG